MALKVWGRGKVEGRTLTGGRRPGESNPIGKNGSNPRGEGLGMENHHASELWAELHALVVIGAEV